MPPAATRTKKGGQLQDQVMAVTGSRWDKVRPELGVANGNGCQGLGRQNHGLVRGRGGGKQGWLGCPWEGDFGGKMSQDGMVGEESTVDTENNPGKISPGFIFQSNSVLGLHLQMKTVAPEGRSGLCQELLAQGNLVLTFGGS